MTRILIFANGKLHKSKRFRQRIQRHAATADTIICADGGSRHCAELGLVPDLLVGDLDSTPETLQRQFAQQGVELRRHPPRKNETDLELALACALELPGRKELHLVAAVGGRLDMTLATLLLPAATGLRNVNLCIHGKEEECRLLTPGRHTIAGEPGQRLSFLPLATVKGLELAGVEYVVRDFTLKLGSSRGLSNCFAGKKCSVRFDKGLLLMVREV